MLPPPHKFLCAAFEGVGGDSHERTPEDLEPYELLLGDAMKGDPIYRWLCRLTELMKFRI